MIILKTIIFALLVYVLWSKVLKMYYRYWFYTSQGVKAIGFPLPLLGNAYLFKDIMEEKEEDGFIKCLNEAFNYKVPPIFLNFIADTPALIISDPEIINELFITKAKYTDKYYRTKQ